MRSHGEDDSKSTLSRELSDFLVQLSIAMQKHAIYPAGHPLLASAVEGVMEKLRDLLLDRTALSIGIARRQLIIEGVGTDPEHPLLKELATRLHKHGLGAIKLMQGFTGEELADALATIAVDPSRLERPLGDDAAAISDRWTHVQLYPLNYERLQLLYEGTDDEGDAIVKRAAGAKAAQLWVGMARAALMLDADAEMSDESLKPLVVAEAIEGKQQEEAYDQVIVGYLLQIADELKKQGGTPEAIELQKRISELVKSLSPAALQKLLQMGGDAAQRKQFLLNAAQGMTVEAVLDLVKASAADGRQTISHSMMRLFGKLSKYAESDSDPKRRSNAESTLREQMTRLVADWNLDDPNPTAYGKVLHQMSRGSRSQESSAYTEVEPERIIQMGFEIGVGGPRFDAALDAMLNSARLQPLLDMIDRAPDKEFAESVWLYLDSHNILWSALGEASIDLAVLERIVRRKGLSAVDAIIDVAEEVKDVKLRNRLLEIVLSLGDEVGAVLSARLDGARAEMQRELFMLLGRLNTLPTGFDATRFLAHHESVVRREAVRLLLKFLETREQAIIAGVTDSDERALFYALTSAQEGGCPPRAVPIVRQRIESGNIDGSLKTLAIRVLASADNAETPVVEGRGRTSQMLRALDIKEPAEVATAGAKTRNWLVSKAARRSRFLKRWQLEPKSSEMLAALSALAAYWSHDPEVQQILNLAIRSNDPELRKALGAQRITGRFKTIPD